MRIRTMMACIAALVLLASACAPVKTDVGNLLTNASIRDKPYSQVLEQRIASAEQNVTPDQQRPDYLPAAMFARLLPMPKDFYQVRMLVRLGRIADLDTLEEQYWQQPEFFPNFEEIGVKVLQNPPKDRWGAAGLASYPAETIETIVPGETAKSVFYLKSNYLVETYQGISLGATYPATLGISQGVALPDGNRSVTQDPDVVKNYFDVKVTPAQFVLEPNFPIYSVNGTKKVMVEVTAKSGTPQGDYVIALETQSVPKDLTTTWTRQYLNLYTDGSSTKLDRPYYSMFVHVTNGGS